MDRSSAVIANQLVGNPIDSPVLEITIQGPKILIEGAAQLAITGANLSPTLNGNALPMYESVRTADSSNLSFGRLQSGCRAYLAVRGRWEAKQWLGSVSPPPFQADILTPHSLISKNSILNIETDGFIPKRFYAPYARPDFRKPQALRLLKGPEYGQFDPTFIDWLFEQAHHLSPDSNRMGCRLEEPGPILSRAREMVSSAVLPGTVQVTAAGKVMILMADAQTTGGYPRLGIVPEQELNRLAQVCPGQAIRFVL
jgi:antagonist of KipI